MGIGDHNIWLIRLIHLDERVSQSTEPLDVLTKALILDREAKLMERRRRERLRS